MSTNRDNVVFSVHLDIADLSLGNLHYSSLFEIIVEYPNTALLTANQHKPLFRHANAYSFSLLLEVACSWVHFEFLILLIHVETHSNYLLFLVKIPHSQSCVITASEEMVGVVVDCGQTPYFVSPFGIGTVVASHHYLDIAEVGPFLHFFDICITSYLIDFASESANEQPIFVCIQSPDACAKGILEYFIALDDDQHLQISSLENVDLAILSSSHDDILKAPNSIQRLTM